MTAEFRKRTSDPQGGARHRQQRIGWDRATGEVPNQAQGCRHGSNLVLAGRCYALVRITKDGQVEARNGSQDIGTGTRTMGMVVAEELGLDLDQVTTRIGIMTKGPASGGSTTIGTVTPAARLAAHHAKRQLLEVVAERKGWIANELDLKDQEVYKVGEGSLNLNFGRPQPDGRRCYRGAQGRPRRNYEGFSDTNAGVQAALVEVGNRWSVWRRWSPLLMPARSSTR